MSWKRTIVTVIKENRVTVPKKFMEAHRLEPPRLLTLKLSGMSEDWESIEFYSQLRRHGQITIPTKLFRELKLRHGQSVLLRIFIDGKA